MLSRAVMKRLILTGVACSLLGLVIGSESRRHSAVREVRQEFLGKQTIELDRIDVHVDDKVRYSELVVVRQEVNGEYVFEKSPGVNPEPAGQAILHGRINGKNVMIAIQW